MLRTLLYNLSNNYNNKKIVKFHPLLQWIFTTPTSNNTNDMIAVLKARFPLAKSIEVIDVSGGCGAMYEILVESVEFKGLSIVKQHRLINETLKDQIKTMHGLRIHTVIPKDNAT